MHLACCRIHIMRTSGAAVLIICGTKRRQLITVNSSVTNAVCVEAVCCLKCGCFIRLGPCKFQNCLSIGLHQVLVGNLWCRDGWLGTITMSTLWSASHFNLSGIFICRFHKQVVYPARRCCTHVACEQQNGVYGKGC